jgi:hypothetical protein
LQAVFPRRAPLRIQAARIGGVEVPNQKYVEFSLQYIFGIGHTTAKAILASTGVENKRTKVPGLGGQRWRKDPGRRCRSLITSSNMGRTAALNLGASTLSVVVSWAASTNSRATGSSQPQPPAKLLPASTHLQSPKTTAPFCSLLCRT